MVSFKLIISKAVRDHRLFCLARMQLGKISEEKTFIRRCRALHSRMTQYLDSLSYDLAEDRETGIKDKRYKEV